MIVNVINEQTALKFSVEQVQQIVQQVITLEGHHCDEVNIYFVDTSTISQLHNQFFGDPTPTDCISFPLDDDPLEDLPHRVLGEVFVCPATALAYAAEHATDAYVETMLYIIHGLLHLMGYQDLEEKDCLIMRAAETRHLHHLQSSHQQLHPLTC